MRAFAGLAIALLVFACDKPTTPTHATPDGSSAPAADLEPDPAEAGSEAELGTPFADAQLFFELNATDNDLGLQLFVDHEGWKRLRVLDPRRRDLLLIAAAGRLARLGITELRFESEEPEPEEVLALFPPGEYRFRGKTVEGEYLATNVRLSHELPPAPTFTPSGGALVDRRDAVVEWSAPGAELVEIILESDELDDVLDVTLSGPGRRLRIPSQFLRPGVEYKIEVIAIAESGNRSLAESTFRVRK
ncbi:MAG TPA: hypothetical protein VFZ26_04145 [Gemmatimonadales bacterium]